MTSSRGEAMAGNSASRLPFSGATGKGLKIAVIDSGVHVKHPHIIAKTSGLSMALGGDPNDPSGSWEDLLGHGTAVTAAIQEKAPEAEYLAVKLFDKSLSTTSTRLMHAIDWAITHGMDLINLSLGTPNMAYGPAFQALVDRAEAAGVILVCARYENGDPVLPGFLTGVVSVDVDWQLTRHAYRVMACEGGSYYLASGFPRPLPVISPAHNLSGISFAVANMTGIVARAREQSGVRSLAALHDALASELLKLNS